MKRELLRIYNGQIRLNPYEALKGIHLNLLEGEALGMLFANLCEKDVLLKVLRGECFFSAGRLYIDEKNVTSPRTVQQSVYVIHRETMLNDWLSIVENVYFSLLPPVLMNLDMYNEMLADLFEQFDIQIDVNSSVRRLTAMQKIAVELIKAYVLKKQIVVLADLSLSITSNQMSAILKIVDQLKKRGFGFIIIESFLDVMFNHTENIAIIKGGRTTGLFASSEIAIDRLRTSFMRDAQLGASAFPTSLRIPLPAQCDASLRFENVCMAELNNLCFSIARGGLMKILYLNEQNCNDFLALLRGEIFPQSGRIFLDGRQQDRVSPRKLRQRGLRVVEGNPQEKMLLQNMSVFDNIALALPGHVPGMWVKRRYRENMRRMAIELCGEDFWNLPIPALSSVQLQKLIYCKQLLYHPAVLVCVNPFTGMDYQVDGVTEMMIEKARAQGAAVLIVASYLSEFESRGELMYLSEGRLFSKD